MDLNVNRNVIGWPHKRTSLIQSQSL